ncbi:dTDP-4-dehydrorhamnose reductase [Ruegeria halocynthiae]|uniref:dTDP-4-dehydrorhamnose reductase n=1 Tax=Ruegeria halocynthiae TaxID=985054 RepID=A0A1H3DNW6_9RHOB|nr:sugar nucleotide-binding protein [Ruegeria halocynthiae]SDX68106.1 dTDP-4-dehydrorhamnose reductase [Ruegeria halocynthiae]
MQQTVLILGATGRFGRNAAQAFTDAGWAVHRFDRRSEDLRVATRGVDVIVNAWNPPYPDWAQHVPDLHRQVIAAASHRDLTVIVPGNVYVFGADTPGPWSGETPHLARNPLGRVRIEMEEAYRASSVRTIILRAGDFIDTTESGNWFDQVMIKYLRRGRLVYPGNPETPHAWAYLPDLTRAAVALAEMRNDLPRFCDVPFAGYTVTGAEMARMLSQVTGQHVEIKQMAWWPLHIARPFWRLASHLLEMRYLWETPHRLDDGFFDELLPGFAQTDLSEALRNAITKPAESETREQCGAALQS